jgi:hypothetical protein
MSFVSARDGVNKPPYPLLVARVSSRQWVEKEKASSSLAIAVLCMANKKEILKEFWSFVYVIVSLECTPDTLKRTLAG